MKRLGATGLVAAAAAALLSGCAAGPDYVRPEVPTPAAFKEGVGWKVAQPQDAALRRDWWKMFGDPQLDALIAQVDVSNQNVRLAEAQWRQAVGVVQQARAGLFPTLSLNNTDTRSRSPSLANAPVTSTAAVSVYSLSLNASWAPDFWGGVRRTVEGDVANAQAGAADVANARLLAQAQLALDYFQLRAVDAQRQLLRDTVAAYSKSLELTRNRYAAGVVAKVDVVQAETQVKSTQAQAIDLGVQRAQLEHAIAILIGKPPAELAIAPLSLNAALSAVPVEIPSELLQRRPDVASAERRMAAANAQIGVATAAYYPSITFSGATGYRGSAWSQLLSAPNRFWSVGAAIGEAIFDAGARGAVVDQAKAAHDASVASYRQTVLTAFQQVEDNLAALRILEEEAAAQDDAVKAARESTELTLNQYKAGTVSYLNVIIIQAAQLNNEAAAVRIQGQRLAATVALIQALGGGWDASDLAEADSPSPRPASSAAR
ncbi:MAG TPA: efflux transporter outer membrane subunit [Burkholderiales bacterium]|nr:efflux transporter outer membrane subunit [Burkholderiales bacterium]